MAISKQPAAPTQADRRMVLGMGLFRVGMLVFLAATLWAITNSSVIAKGLASGGAAAALVGMVLALIARRQGGRTPDNPDVASDAHRFEVIPVHPRRGMHNRPQDEDPIGQSNPTPI